MVTRDLVFMLSFSRHAVLRPPSTVLWLVCNVPIGRLMADGICVGRFGSNDGFAGAEDGFPDNGLMNGK